MSWACPEELFRRCRRCVLESSGADPPLVRPSWLNTLAGFAAVSTLYATALSSSLTVLPVLVFFWGS
jgi:hypothetical protein